MLSPDKMIASFPHSTLPKISYEPHYKSLAAMGDEMKEKYMLIPSRRGGGTYRYLRELLSHAVYGTIAPGTVFVSPPDPGPLVIPTGSTNINSVNLNRYYLE